VDFAVQKGNVVLHCFDAQFPSGEDGGWNHAHGVTHFEFETNIPRRKGGGYYVSYNEGRNLRSGRVEFRLRKLTPDLVAFCLSKPSVNGETDRRNIVRVMARHLAIRRVVITGGPGSGKTEVVKMLRARGRPVLGEAAMEVIETEVRAHGSTVAFKAWRAANPLEMQRRIFQRQRLNEQAMAGSELVFMDRTGLDCIAYIENANLVPDPEMIAYSEEMVCARVFMLDTLFPFPSRPETGRSSGYAESMHIRQSLIEAYTRFGHMPIVVPMGSIEERVEFILKRVEDKRA
jgi:predicted ATPase